VEYFVKKRRKIVIWDGTLVHSIMQIMLSPKQLSFEFMAHLNVEVVKF
jgi:hypothetical protein